MKIVIIGGGASGMILASKLSNKNVTLFERNAKLGKKLLLTGNGKCNFTNDDFDNIDTIYNNDLAKSVYKKFDKDDFLKYMEDIGIVPKKEIHKGKTYYYPNSNKSSSVYYLLLDRINSNNINIIYNTYVKDIVVKDGKFYIFTDDKEYIFDKIVISTGGMSYKNTGSDGNMYNVLQKLGHNVIKPLPALCGFDHSCKMLKKTKGFRVDANATFEIIKDGNSMYHNEYGEIQFTENGISGIPIMNLSRYISRELYNGHKVKLHLDFYNVGENQYDNKYKILCDELKIRRKNIYYKEAKDFLCGFLPDEIAYEIVNRIGALELKVENIQDSQIINMAKEILDFRLDISSIYSFDNAQITIGGVDVNDINIDTLESKKAKNMYIMGEILDIDGPCGGYNLQLMYSTASIVAKNI